MRAVKGIRGISDCEKKIEFFAEIPKRVLQEGAEGMVKMTCAFEFA
jgi:hypothetical protein